MSNRSTTHGKSRGSAIAWLLAGVVGHDPWKTDDVLHLGIAFGMSGGDWLVPRIAGDLTLSAFRAGGEGSAV